jgi:O-methyltransferase involved in polyketide biosynthesis
MPDHQPPQLGAVQETLFIPLFDRARHSRGSRPLLNDPKAVEIAESVNYHGKYDKNVGGVVTVLRTAVLDSWVRRFLRENPAATVVELGTGLNTRFERVDNGTVHWIDLDLPDTIELRSRFFADTDRRRMLAASLLDEGWLDALAEDSGPYLFVSEGVLTYLDGDAVEATLSRIAARFPESWLALDIYHQQAVRWQQRSAAKGVMDARFSWACDDPRELERLGLQVVDSARPTRPPHDMRGRLPLRYRLLLPVFDLAVRQLLDLALFRARSA